MLTAVRRMADAAERGATLPEIVAAATRPSTATREMLPVLREAGVVDAGAAGLVEIVRGIAAAVSGEALPEAPERQEEIGIDAIHQELSKYRYCTVFVVEGDDLDLDALEVAARGVRRLAARRRRLARRSRCTCTPTTRAAR